MKLLLRFWHYFTGHPWPDSESIIRPNGWFWRWTCKCGAKYEEEQNFLGKRIQ